MSRKEAREVIMKYLYQMEITDDYSFDTLSYLYSDKIDEDDKDFINISLNSVILNLDNLDNKINMFLKGWKSNRIPKIDLAILRLAINEIDNLEEIPTSVSINEAVDMAKRYSTGDSYRFINGVLGSYYRSLGDKNNEST